MRRGPPHHVALLETTDGSDDLSLKDTGICLFDESFYCYSQVAGWPFEFKNDPCSTMSDHTYQSDEEHLYIPDYLVTTNDVIWHGLWSIITWQYLRFRLFSIYARLLLIAIATNLGALACLVSQLWRDGFISTPSENDEVQGKILLAVSLNVLITLSLRNECVINILYRIFVINSSNLPLWLRKRVARLYGLGGFHSGCAFSAFLWYTFYSGLIIGALMNGQQDKTHSVRLSIAILIWVIFVVIIGLALPTFRERMQDYFELVH